MTELSHLYQQAILKSLRNFCYKDAVFVAERLCYSHLDSSAANLILAYCLFCSQEYQRSILYCQKSVDKRAKYIEANCLMNLKKYADCEQACNVLLSGSIKGSAKEDSVSLIAPLENFLPSIQSNDCILAILGSCYKKIGKKLVAVKHFSESLQANALSWSCYEELCELGKPLDISNLLDGKSKKVVEKSKLIEPTKRKSFRSTLNKEAPIKSSQLSTFKGKENYGESTEYNEIMSVIKIIASGMAFLSSFDCKKALECFQSLPKNHFESPYVLSKVGMAHFELGNYKQAEYYFLLLRKVDSCYIYGLEIYSSVLWHLKKETELSNLSKEVLGMTKSNPIGWCIAGNSFSLLKQHSNAMKCLKRCVQIDESFYYAFTLLGHEGIITENFDQSVEFFKSAISINPRHYNAWYGLGVIYLRQEKYDLSEYYFKKAVAINSGNAVLLCNLGIAYGHQSKIESSLESFNQAMSIDANNPFIRFQRAKQFFKIGKFSESLKDLRLIVDVVSNEPSIYILMGKTLLALGHESQALQSFSLAKEFSQKNHIDIPAITKETIEMAQDELISS